MNSSAISKSLVKLLTVVAVIVTERIVAQMLGTGGWSVDLATGSGLGFLAVWGIGHCDGLDGPVVQLAIKALDSGNVSYVLPWVQENDEPEIRRAFDHAVSVRKLSPDAKALAERYFFETLVRLHRAGEGAPFTGLKPAGRDLGPAIPAADMALRDGSIEKVIKLLTDAVSEGLHLRFHAVSRRRGFAPDDVKAGREFVEAYVPYIHYVERLWRDATSAAHGHHSEHAEEAEHVD
ncbi:MAG TPA: DUF6448 family protein [Gemmatimonadaceae bacterium]|nr:DUF6448 family protein [Gemmatimonadaceae bacterium]